MSGPQNNLNLIPTLKLVYFLPQKPKKYIRLKARIKGDRENISCSGAWVDLKHILDHNPTTKKAQFLPLFKVNLFKPQLKSTSTQFQLNFKSSSFQPNFNLILKSTSASLWSKLSFYM